MNVAYLARFQKELAHLDDDYHCIPDYDEENLIEAICINAWRDANELPHRSCAYDLCDRIYHLPCFALFIGDPTALHLYLELLCHRYFDEQTDSIFRYSFARRIMDRFEHCHGNHRGVSMTTIKGPDWKFTHGLLKWICDDVKPESANGFFLDSWADIVRRRARGEAVILVPGTY